MKPLQWPNYQWQNYFCEGSIQARLTRNLYDRRICSFYGNLGLVRLKMYRLKCQFKLEQFPELSNNVLSIGIIYT